MNPGLPRPLTGWWLMPLGALLALALLGSLQIGATQVGLQSLPRLLAGHGTASEHLILLGAAGAVMQGLFRNPLADPGLIGVSSGAALAASITIVLGDSLLAPWLAPLGRWAVPLAGLLGGLGATWLLYLFATQQGRTSVSSLLLGGIALAAFAGALTGVLVFTANDRQLRDLSFWSLGSLSGASWPKLGLLLPFIAGGALLLPWLAPTLNLLLLGEAEAFHLGARVERAKSLSMLAVASLVGASVATTGVIGFIGVLVPHLARLLGGPDHRFLLPASALLGAALLLIADTVGRSLVAPAEMPVGIITATIGAPCFFWLLRRHQRGART